MLRKPREVNRNTKEAHLPEIAAKKLPCPKRLGATHASERKRNSLLPLPFRASLAAVTRPLGMPTQREKTVVASLLGPSASRPKDVQPRSSPSSRSVFCVAHPPHPCVQAHRAVLREVTLTICSGERERVGTLSHESPVLAVCLVCICHVAGGLRCPCGSRCGRQSHAWELLIQYVYTHITIHVERYNRR